MPRQKWTPTTPWVKSNKKTQAVWPTYVCRNPNCKSYGKSHPNCKCGAPSFSAQSKALEYDAKGGEVGESHFCLSGSAHQPGCELYLSDGGEIASNEEFQSNPEMAVDHAVYHHGLHHVLTKAGHTRSEDPRRVADEHLDSHRRGRRALEAHGKGVYESDPEKLEHGAGSQALRSHIEHLNAHPEEMLEIGGGMDKDLPMHAGVLAAKAATAQSYLQSIKPPSQQPRPLDRVSPPSPGAEANYERQMGIAENPRSIYGLLRDGRLKPADLITLRTLYPKLADSMQRHVGEALINAKTENKTIPYKQKLKTSLLLGEPLDSTMTQASMMACIVANGDAQTTTQGETPGGNKGQPSAPTQKAMAKVDRLYETPLESVDLNRKK